MNFFSPFPASKAAGKSGSRSNVDSLTSSNAPAEAAWAYRSMRMARSGGAVADINASTAAAAAAAAAKLRQSTRTAPVGENSSYADDLSSNQSQTQGKNDKNNNKDHPHPHHHYQHLIIVITTSGRHYLFSDYQRNDCDPWP